MITAIVMPNINEKFQNFTLSLIDLSTNDTINLFALNGLPFAGEINCIRHPSNCQNTFQYFCGRNVQPCKLIQNNGKLRVIGLRL